MRMRHPAQSAGTRSKIESSRRYNLRDSKIFKENWDSLLSLNYATLRLKITLKETSERRLPLIVNSDFYVYRGKVLYSYVF